MESTLYIYQKAGEFKVFDINHTFTERAEIEAQGFRFVEKINAKQFIEVRLNDFRIVL